MLFYVMWRDLRTYLLHDKIMTEDELEELIKDENIELIIITNEVI